MSKIVDPKLDGLFRNGPAAPQPTSLTVATPMSADQLLAMIASEQMTVRDPQGLPIGERSAQKSVDIACQIVAEAVAAVTSSKLDRMVKEVQARYAGNGATQLPTQ